jgi:hypothetical protein
MPGNFCLQRNELIERELGLSLTSRIDMSVNSKYGCRELWNVLSHHEQPQWEEFLSPSQEQHSEVTPALATEISDPSLRATCSEMSYRAPGH